MPKGKHIREIAASTENHTVSSLVLPWSKKPIERMMDEVHLGPALKRIEGANLPKEFNKFLEAFCFWGRTNMISTRPKHVLPTHVRTQPWVYYRCW